MSQNTAEKMHQVRLRHQENTYMRTKTLAGQRYTVAWPVGSWAWCARGRQIETRGSHHIILHPISRQIGFSGSGGRVNTKIPSFSKINIIKYLVLWLVTYACFIIENWLYQCESCAWYIGTQTKLFKKRLLVWTWQYTAKLLFKLPQSSFVVAAQYLQNLHWGGSDGVPPRSPILLVCREGNFGVLLKVAPLVFVWLPCCRVTCAVAQ